MGSHAAHRFDVRPEGVSALVAAYETAQAATLEDVFPAALLAPLWRALLATGAIDAPGSVDLAQVRLRVRGPDRIDLAVPARGGGTARIAVRVSGPGAGDVGLPARIRHAAQGLATALAQAGTQATFAFDLDIGQGQKPHG